MGLQDYKELVGTVASFVTIAQMFSGTLICKEIYQKGSSEGKDPIPFIGGISMGVLMLLYAFIVNDAAMITVNVCGLLLSCFYVIFFFIYTPKKSPLIWSMIKALAFTMVFMMYAYYEDPGKLEFRWGILVTCLLFLLIAAPLFNIKDIIRTKNTDILPFPMIVMGTFVGALWLLYGIILDNYFMIFQNMVGLFLQIVQLSLFVIYPKSSKAPKKEIKKDN